MAAEKAPAVISDLTEPVPTGLITGSFITKCSVLNFQSSAGRRGNVAELSAINDVIKSPEWPLKSLKERAANRVSPGRVQGQGQESERRPQVGLGDARSEEHTSELQSR